MKSSIKSLVTSELFAKVYLTPLDMFCWAMASQITFYMRYNIWRDLSDINWVQSFSVMLVLVGCLHLLDLYNFEFERSGPRVLARLFLSIAISGIIVTAANYWMGGAGLGISGRGLFISSLFLFVFFAMISRYFLIRILRKASGTYRWLVIGEKQSLEEFWAEAQESKLNQFFFLVDQNSGSEVKKMPVVGFYEDLDIWLKERWAGVILASKGNIPKSLQEKLLVARLNGTRMVSLTQFYEMLWEKVPVFFLADSWFLSAEGFGLLHDPVELQIKRWVDFFCSIVLFIVFLPITTLICILIKLESKGPIIYKQERVGEDGRVFTIYKFRSMVSDAETDGIQWAEKNDSRITRVGSFIRKTRIDEIPQIVNVLKGDMSFIGPRPERPEITYKLEKDIPYFNFRHLVKPGITGWAQVMYTYGASRADAIEKLKFDLYYIRNYSLLLDVVILFKTIRVVVFGMGR